MATFNVRFLGCKVSHLDAQEVRERLLADGHVERRGEADVAVVNTCCVTNEALSKSRQAAARAARTHGRVYVTGCAANLEGDAFVRSARERRRRSPPQRGDAGGRRRRPRCARLRARRCAPRARSRVREDPGRVQLLVQLLRDPARPRRHAQPPRARRARRDPAPRRAGSPRDRPHRESTSAASATATPATRSRDSSARRARSRGSHGSVSRRSRRTT